MVLAETFDVVFELALVVLLLDVELPADVELEAVDVELADDEPDDELDDELDDEVVFETYYPD